MAAPDLAARTTATVDRPPSTRQGVSRPVRQPGRGAGPAHISFADGTRVLPEVTEAQEVDRMARLGGRPLGALADHRRNPVL